MAIVYLGIDRAKSVFALHGVDASGRPALVRPSVPRSKLLNLVAGLPPCTIGMEVCSGAHHWARLFSAHGHTVRVMQPLVLNGAAMTQIPCRHGTDTIPPQMPDMRLQALPSKPDYRSVFLHLRGSPHTRG